LDTATATASNAEPITEERIKMFALTIASACIDKLGLTKGYRTNVRYYKAPCPMPWIEIGVTPLNKDITTHEFSVCLPFQSFVCDTKDERSALAQYIFRIIQLGVQKWENK
jgi:hypothetical protein